MSILRRMLLFVSPLLGLARPLSAPFDRGVARCPVWCCTPALWVRYRQHWAFGAEKSLLGGFWSHCQRNGWNHISSSNPSYSTWPLWQDKYCPSGLEVQPI